MPLSDHEHGPLFIDPDRNAQQLYAIATIKPVLWLPQDKEELVYEQLGILLSTPPSAQNAAILERTVRLVFNTMITEILRVDKQYPIVTFWRWITSLIELEGEYLNLYREIVTSIKQHVKVTNPNYTAERFAREEVFRTGLLRAKGIESPNYGIVMLNRAKMLLTTTTMWA